MNSREKQERLAAAKRKVQEYRQQHRNEAENRRESQPDTQVKIEKDLPAEVQPLTHPEGNGAVALDIGESGPPPRASPPLPVPSDNLVDAHNHIPPTTIEFLANANEEPVIEIMPIPIEGLNQSSQEDDDMSTSNTNTSPVTTPNERLARASNVREWVESDTLTKSSHEDIQRPESDPSNTAFDSEYNQQSPPENFVRHANSNLQFTSSHYRLDSRNGSDMDILAKELKDLRQNNLVLKEHEREYIIQLQGVEKVIQTLTHEKQALQNEITEFMPLKHKFQTLEVANVELKVVISDLRSQLNSALVEGEAKQKAFEDMQSAFIKVSASKRELESNWDIEQERQKIMEEALKEKSLRVEELIHENDRQVQKEKALETVAHALEEQLKELKNKNIVLEKRLYDLLDATAAESKCTHEHHVEDGDIQEKVPALEQSSLESVHVQQAVDCENGEKHVHPHGPCTDNGHAHDDHHNGDHAHDHDHEHGKCSGHDDHHHSPDHHHDHGKEHHDQDHEHGKEHHDHDHDHDHHGHNHDHDHHGHDHDHDHHDHEHGHGHRRVILPTANGPTPMEKKLARLEWENLTFREELDKLAANLKVKTVEATDCEKLRTESERLRSEVNRLEHLVIQLQGENDTIGDYITLYQSQKLVLKEKVREKDREMETLSRERAELKSKMEELNQLLRNFNENTADDKEKPIEKISELITTINNSSAASIHSCSECSGNLINI